MNKRSIALFTRQHLATFSAVGSLLLSSAVLVACGGGGGVAGGGTGATVTGLSVGIVSDKGSTIVNGVEFLDDSATVNGDDDSATVFDDKAGKTRSLVGDDVKRGMEVEIEHGAITCPTPNVTVAACTVLPVSTATKMTFGNNSLVAPIKNFTPGSATGVTPFAPTTFTLLGQAVTTSASTILSFESLVTALANDVVVEVHGVFDSVSGVTTATRIEVKAASVATFTGALRLRGLLDLSVTPATIGGTQVTLTDAQKTGLTTGQVVRAKVSGSAEPFAVLSVKSTQRKLDDHKGAEVEIEGVIEADPVVAASGDVSFTIRSAAVQVPKALATASLVKGARIEVEGKVSDTGVLVASKVKLHTEDGAGSVGGGTGGTGGGTTVGSGVSAPEEFHGRIVKPDGSGGFVNSYDATTRQFGVWATTSVAGVTSTTLVKIIQIDDNTKFVGNKGVKNFSEAALAKLGPGGLLIIDGQESADGSVLIASKIKLDVSSE
jgi:hypothetical protein